MANVASVCAVAVANVSSVSGVTSIARVSGIDWATWVQHFYDDMVEGTNCSYDAGNAWFAWSGPGPYLGCNAGKVWWVGYYPSKVRLSYNIHMGSGSITVLDDSSSSIGTVDHTLVPAAPGSVEINLTWTPLQDFRQLNTIYFGAVDQVTNIEFLA